MEFGTDHRAVVAILKDKLSSQNRRSSSKPWYDIDSLINPANRGVRQSASGWHSGDFCENFLDAAENWERTVSAMTCGNWSRRIAWLCYMRRRKNNRCLQKQSLLVVGRWNWDWNWEGDQKLRLLLQNGQLNYVFANLKKLCSMTLHVLSPITVRMVYEWRPQWPREQRTFLEATFLKVDKSMISQFEVGQHQAIAGWTDHLITLIYLASYQGKLNIE